MICPYKDCAKAIAVNAIDSHFRYEHKKVACITTSLEARNGLNLSLGDIKYHETLCIILINLMEDEEKCSPEAK